MQSNGKRLARNALAGLFAAVLITGCGGGGGAPAPAPGPDVPAPAPGAAPPPGPAPAPAPAGDTTSYSLLKESGLVPQKTRAAFDNARAYLDVDGDGVLELFSVEMRYNPATTTPATAPLSAFRFFRKQPDGSIVHDPSLLPAGNLACVHPRKAVLSDFNLDGRLDIFVACHGYDAAPFPGERSKVVLSQPDGTYAISDASTQVGFFHSAAAADFNGDGSPDVVVADSSFDPSIQVWLNDGQGGFTRSSDYVPNELRRQANFFTVDVPDVDGDGKFDLFVGGHEWENAQSTVYINPGSGDFTGVAGTVLPALPNEGVVLDIAITGSGADRAAWLLRTSGGDGTFYQSLVVQKVLWPSLTHSVALYKRPHPWQAWMIPAVIGGVPKLVSDDVGVTSIDIAYASPAADKYQGTWFMACQPADGAFQTETVTLSKGSATRLTGQFVIRTYGDAACAGAATGTESLPLAVTIDAQTTATRAGLPLAFDQVTSVVTGAGTFKWLMGVLPDDRMLIDFGDGGPSSSTVYPADPNEGESTYLKQ